MGICNGIHPVVRFRSGEIWHFYSGGNRGIFFRRLDENGVWGEPVELLRNIRDDFSVRIDRQDRLHLICRSDKGEILYMQYNGKVWFRQVLSGYDPARYVIRYPVILPLQNQIHVLFAIGTSFNAGFWTLYHYYWDETEWHSSEITRLTAGHSLSPFAVDLSEKHIHLVYRGLAADRYQIFHCRYYPEHGIWSTPENVTDNDDDCNMPSLLIRDDRLHLVWTSPAKEDGKDRAVNYKSKAISDRNRAEWSGETTLSGPDSDAAFPHLLWVKEKLWCVWYRTDTLYGCHAEKDGTAWSPPEKIDCNGIRTFYQIDYSTNNEREREAFRIRRIPGSVEDGFFLPIAGEYMTLPEPSPERPLPDGSSGADFPSKEKRQAGFLPEVRSEEPAGKIRETCRTFRSPVPEAFTDSVLPAQTRPAPQPSLEKALLREIDKREETGALLAGKLEENSRLTEMVLEEAREIVALLKGNTEKLQTLLQDMEQIKSECKPLPTKKPRSRFFRSGP